MIEIVRIDTSQALYPQEIDLRVRVLREPLGMSRESVTFPFENEAEHFLAVERECVVGCALLHRRELASKVFQMCVEPTLQRRGLGRQLIAALECWAKTQGIERLFLHARAQVAEFYVRLGYQAVGQAFQEIGMPHLRMEKSLPQR